MNSLPVLIAKTLCVLIYFQNEVIALVDEKMFLKQQAF